MAISFLDFSNKHAVAGSTRIHATVCGHMYSVKLTTAADNGNIIGRGAYVAPEYYAEAAASNTFAGKIIDQAPNGNWYVEVTAAGANDLLVLQVTNSEGYDYTKRMQDDAYFYNAAGDIVRCYPLEVGDVFELSAAGFTGTPAKNKTVTVANKKLTVGA